jgi:tetratricopeptide (TPR) repeat protein
LWERIKVRGGLVIVIFLLGLIFYKTTYIDFRASLYLMKGVEARFNKEWQAAINHYKKAVSIDPYLLTAHYRLAYAYNEVGDLDKAIETYKEILQIAPHYAKTEANIGKVYMGKGMPNEALIYFKKAETLNPYDIDLLCSIGSLYMRLGDLSNAKCYVRRALTIEPGNEYASSVMKELK